VCTFYSIVSVRALHSGVFHRGSVAQNTEYTLDESMTGRDIGWHKVC